jgi:hypothetical protein
MSAMHRTVLAACMLATACSGASTTPKAGHVDPVPPGTTEAAAPAGDGNETGTESAAGDAASTPDDAPAPPPAAPKPSRKPVLAREQPPPGAEALSPEESGFVKGECKPVLKVIQQRARKDRSRDGKNQRASKMLRELKQNPPTIAGVDVKRCTDLLIKDFNSAMAATLEASAINDIKMIVVGLAGAWANNQKLCPSTSPVPRKLELLKNGAIRVPPSAYDNDAWRCVNFNRRGAPQAFQYRLVTDAKTKRYTISARGYPVPGRPAVELFLEGDASKGGVQPSSDVYRR